MNWVDWGIVVIVAIATLSGLRRGMILTLTGLAAQIGSLIAAFVLTRPVSVFLETRFAWAARLATWLAGSIRLPADFATTKVSELTSGELWTMLEQSGLPEQYQDAIVTWIAESPGTSQATLAEFIHQSLGMLLLNVLVFVGLLILTRWLIRAFGRGVSDAAHTVGAGGIDRLGGMALGLLQGAVAVALILGLALPFLATWAPAVVAAVNASLLSPWLIQGFHLVAPWLSQIGLTIWDRLR
jgi:uncharacterized membrane protein required for colicin V production